MARIFDINKLRMIHMRGTVSERPNLDEIETLAADILQKYRLHYLPINLYEITEAEGIDVYEIAFKRNVSGLIEKDGQKVEIFINEDDVFVRQRFTLAHELGHYFLHLRDTSGNYFDTEASMFRNGGSDPTLEIEANKFAAALLMPEDEVRYEYKFISNINDLAYRFQVSRQAMEFRLLNLGLL